MTPVVLADGTSIPLEKWTDTTGDHRYRIIEFGDAGAGKPHLAEPVPPASTVAAYPDHRIDCPDFANGL